MGAISKEALKQVHSSEEYKQARKGYNKQYASDHSGKTKRGAFSLEKEKVAKKMGKKEHRNNLFESPEEHIRKLRRNGDI